MGIGFNNNIQHINRKKKNYCSHCGKKLSAKEKGKSFDFGMMDDPLDPKPICTTSAYFFASKYIKEKGGIIIEK